MIALLVGVFAASWALTGLVRRYALARSVMDVPNERSSHTVPTPRGGGIAIAAALVAGTLAAALLGLAPARVVWVFAAGCTVIATLGWLDDHWGLPVRVRILVQGAVAVGSVLALGGLPTLDVGVAHLPLGPLGSVLAVLGVIWSLNLYNFMDGVDGIAGVEAMSLGGAAGALLGFSGSPLLGLLAGLVAAAAAGFLPWNWQPARIFMGDAGSSVLGYGFAVLALASERGGGLPLLVWVGLYAAFSVDATITLLRRARRGEPVYQAHRRHAYQRLVQHGWPHGRVSLALLALNLALALIMSLWLVWPGALLALLAGALLLAGMAYAAVERLHRMYPPPAATARRAAVRPAPRPERAGVES